MAPPQAANINAQQAATVHLTCVRQTVRQAVALHWARPFNEALGQWRWFSQFDLMGHALQLQPNPPAVFHPCPPVEDLPRSSPAALATHACLRHAFPVLHVPYPYAPFMGPERVQYFSQHFIDRPKHLKRYFRQATLSLRHGYCVLQARLGRPLGDCPPQALPLPPRSYPYAEEHAEINRSAVRERLLAVDKRAQAHYCRALRR